MGQIVLDLETNGLRHEMDRIWCAAVYHIDTKESEVYSDGRGYTPLKKLLPLLEDSETIIGHNLIGFDTPILEEHFGINLSAPGKTIDTLVWSQTLNPDRGLPIGCPASIPNPVTGKNDRVGPHSLHAWGYRVGKKKPVIHDWLTFSPVIIERCLADITINYKVYLALLKEAGLG